MLYQEGGVTGIMFCHQTGGPITGWPDNRDFTVNKVKYRAYDLALRRAFIFTSDESSLDARQTYDQH